MAKLLYNPIMARWMGLSEDESTLFKGKYADYDDPTFLTFRLEFGDWGASVLDRSLLQKGTSLFSAKSLNYDQLPIGLLNCPAPGSDDNTDTYWYNNKSTFNDTENYSAFSYLRSRNEDVRAQYLYGFVNGLYELLKETPYMFKSITGLEALDKVAPSDGARIKKDAAKLTVLCYEGIALKVRTLMELYKKAAWDEVYQRWILPENMREFKMIVYIFERRTFHVGESFDYNGQTMTKLRNDDLNLDVPIKVFECCPCEFDISNANWTGTFEAGFTGEAVAGTTLTINVKNTKTYFKNGLLTDKQLGPYNFDKLLIYDLMDGLEKTATSSSLENNTNALQTTNMTVNQVKQLFMNKNVLLENEDMHEKYYEYILGYSTAGPFSKGRASADKLNEVITSMKASSGQALDEKTITKTKSTTIDKGDLTFKDPRDSWQDTGVTISLLNTISTVVNAVVDRSIDTNKSKATNNGTVKPTYFEVTYKDKTLSDKINALNNGSKFNSNAPVLVDLKPLVFDEREEGEYAMNSIENLRTKPDYKTATIENARLLPENSFKPLIEPDYTPLTEIETDITGGHAPYEMKTPEMEPEREMAGYSDLEMEHPRNLPEDKMPGLIELHKTEAWTETEIDKERKLPEAEMVGLESVKESNKEMHTSIEDSDRGIKTEMPDLSQEARNPEVEYIDPTIEEIVFSVKNLQAIQFDSRMLAMKESNIKFDDVEQIKKDLENILFSVRNLPEMEQTTIENIRELPKEDFKTLLDNVDDVVPKYKINSEDLIQAIETVKTEPTKAFKDIEEITKKNEFEAISLLKANTALLGLEITDTEDRLLNMLSFSKTLSLNSTELKDSYTKRLAKLRQMLRSITEILVRSLPADQIVTGVEGQSTKKSKIKVSMQDLRQISDNLPLIGLDDNTIKDMSIQNIMQLSIDFDTQIKNTKAITGLSKQFETRKKQDKTEKIAMTNVKKPRQKRLGHIELESMREKKKNTTKFETF